MQGFGSNCVVLNDQWFFEDEVYSSRERRIQRSLEEDGIGLLSMLVEQSEEYIREVKTTLGQLEDAHDIDSRLLRKTKEAFTLSWYIFHADLGEYLGPFVERILKTKGLNTELIEEIRNYYFAPPQGSLEYQKEQENIKRIASIYAGRYGTRVFPLRKLPPDVKRLLNLHCTRFRWLTTNELDSQPFSVRDYYHELKQLVTNPVPATATNSSSLTKRIDESLGEKEREFLKLLNRHILIDNYTGELYAKLDFVMQDRLSRQFSMSFRDITWYTFEELERLVKNGTKLSAARLRARRKHRVMIQINGETKCFYSSGDVEKIRSLLRVTRNLAKVTRIIGIVASNGVATGTAKVVRAVKDMRKVEAGDVLVAPTTRVDLMSAILKCSAIVTDTGGITSHAAIVSRELKIPCIVGTEIATQVLTDGDLVEVNATEGFVRILGR